MKAIRPMRELMSHLHHIEQLAEYYAGGYYVT